MAKESVFFQSPDGIESIGTAEVLRFSTASRVVRAGLYAIGGLVGGTVCIVIPIVHLITTWGFPLLGFFMAWRAWNNDVVVLQVEGECPQCKQTISLAGGSVSDSAWQHCSHCKATLQVKTSDDAVPAA